MAEDAPTDTFHIAANAQNKDNARAFLPTLSSADAQTDINNGANLGQLANQLRSRPWMMTSS